MTSPEFLKVRVIQMNLIVVVMFSLGAEARKVPLANTPITTNTS